METYSIPDGYTVWYDAAEKLNDAADSSQDCLSVLCILSGIGAWEITNEQGHVYRAPVDDEESAQLTETRAMPVESYAAGDNRLPTLVARRFGLGEVFIFRNAGYLLQGDNIIDRKVFRLSSGESGEATISRTTLREILEEGGDDDTYWKHLEWRHLQVVVDSVGGQSDRFRLLSEIFRRKADAQMDAKTFIPQGDQFADSDFVGLNF